MTQQTKVEYDFQTTNLFPTNGVGAISANDVRTHFQNTSDSFAFQSTGNTSAPSANDDGNNSSGNGSFFVGNIWIDETANIAYICLDNSTGAAIWGTLSSSGGSVNASGTPLNNQLAVWTAADTIEGEANVTWDGTALDITGDITVSGTVDGRDVAADGALAASALQDVIDDTTPQLGGDLDVNSNSIVSTSNGDITIAPDGTGNVILGNYEFDVDQTVGAGQDNYVMTYNNANGLISLEAAAGGGDVSKVGTPVDNEIGVWTGDGTIEGDTNFTWDGSTLDITGAVSVSGNVVYSVGLGTESSSFTLALADAGTIREIDSTGGAVTITIPTNASVAFPVGTIINFTNLDATSTISLTGDVGVTLNGVSAGSGGFSGDAYEGVTLYKRATDEWVVQGAIGAVA